MSIGNTFQTKEQYLGDADLRKKVYVGTRADAAFLALPFTESDFWGEGVYLYFFALPFFAADLPLSLVMDTVFLPYTVQHDRRSESQ
jgi:uncharacterized protein YceK